MSIDTTTLENVYDHLAQTLDTVPQSRRLLVLTRLALLMSEQIAQESMICRLIDEAAQIGEGADSGGLA